MSLRTINSRMKFSMMKSVLISTLCTLLLAGCSELDPVKQDTPELITKVVLTFNPSGIIGPGVVGIVVTASDPDGDGVNDIAADGPIDLSPGTTYIMSIQLINGLVGPGIPGSDLTEEVALEGAEHQVFFSWTNTVLFSNPAGDGNIDNATDPVNYTGGPFSLDVNGRPLGLTTTWTTISSGTGTGNFRIILKHQPGTKSDTSGITVGETDLDLTFIVNIQ